MHWMDLKEQILQRKLVGIRIHADRKAGWLSGEIFQNGFTVCKTKATANMELEREIHYSRGIVKKHFQRYIGVG